MNKYIPLSYYFILPFILCSLINVHAAESSDSIPKPEIHFQVSLNGNYSKNTATQLLVTTNNYLTIQNKKIIFSQWLNYEYGTLMSSSSSKTMTLQNEIQSNSKLAYQLNRFEPFGLFGFEKSNLRSISARYYTILGSEYKILKTKFHQVSPFLGISNEWTNYKDDDNSAYTDIFYVFGLSGAHELADNRLNIRYNGYFFKKTEKNRWRYNLSLITMFRIIKPLYLSVNLTLLEDDVLGTETIDHISTLSFGVTYKM